MTRAPAPPAALLARPIAHRGLHDANRGGSVVENTLEAARRAIAGGYGIEIDVQASEDGEAIVIHDPTLERTTLGSGPVAALSAAAIGRIGVRGAAPGETVPSLPALLALVAGAAPLLVEIKDPEDALGPVDGALEARVGALLAAYEGPVAAMSFNPHSVAAFRRAAPDVACGLVAWSFASDDLTADRRASLAALADFEAVGASFVSYHWRDLPNPATDRLRAGGVPLISWTIRSKAEAAAARAVSDQITFEDFAA